jgi:glycosyltransferase involved in cell wall biosynthesis
MAINVELIGKVFDNHSLSIVNRNIALQLKDKVNLSISALDTYSSDHKLSKIDAQTISSLVNKPLDSVDVQIRHTYPPMWRWPVGNNTKIVFIQPWEYMAVPFEWQYKFETFADLLITPSEWTREVYLNSGINPQRVVSIPNGYNPDIFNKPNTKDNTKITVLYVGCHQFRKGLDILLSVWSQITKQGTPVQLIIKDTPQVYGASNTQEDIVKLQYKTKCADIIYDDSVRSEEEMAALYKQAHVLVHPYRGEGFGMHVQEAMACGCVPIVTFGGPTDEFVKDFKIASSKRIVNMYEIFGLKAEDAMTQMGGHKWVLEPDANDLAKQLHYVINNLKTISVDTSLLNTWTEVGNKYYEVVTKISNASSTVRSKHV